MHHQRLRCLGIIMETARRVPGLVAKAPRGNAFLVDELKRAVTSAALNVSEGNGRSAPKERARFFDIAIGSLAESATAIEMLVSFQAVDRNEAAEISELVRIAYAMVINIKRATAKTQKRCLSHESAI